MIRFRTLESAIRCVQHFYANNAGIVDFIMRERKPEIPFLMLGLNPPCNYYWHRSIVVKCKDFLRDIFYIE